MYKPSDLFDFLNGLGIHPKKGLSQNFLIDGNIIRKIIKTAEVTADDVILEIGPGPGALTQALLETGATLIAVEKDAVLAKALERFENDRLHIFCADILDFPIEATLDKFKKGKKGKVIANLPYHLTTPILVKLVTMREQFSHLFLMVQDEVAERLTAQPGNAQYGSITVFLNFYSNPKYAFTVKRSCFFPQPGVDSAIIDVELKAPPQIADLENFFKMTRTAFEHRRKMLRASLRDLYPSEKIVEALQAIGVNPQSRPQDLSLEAFLALYKKLV